MRALLIIGVLIASSLDVQAATDGVYYVGDKGAVMGVKEALQASMSGEQIMRCAPVVATPNKSGTSISFKLLKRGVTATGK